METYAVSCIWDSAHTFFFCLFFLPLPVKSYLSIKITFPRKLPLIHSLPSSLKRIKSSLSRSSSILGTFYHHCTR